MEPTLYHGDFYIVMRTALNPLVAVNRGDIVIAHWNDTMIIKRVIARPGDTLEISANQVILNGQVLDEEYIKEPMVTQDCGPILLGEDEYFLMGDNRNASGDSRSFGTFTSQDIYGVVYLDQQVLLWSAFFLFPLGLTFILIYIPDRKEMSKNASEAEPIPEAG